MNQRDPLLHTILSVFVPFWIWYWFYVTGKEIQATYGHKAPSLLLLFAPGILLIISMIILFGSMLSLSDSSGAAGGVAFLLFFFVFFPLSFILSLVYDYKFGGMTEKVLGESASRILIFILLWFVSPAAVFIVQEKLNQLIADGVTPGQVPGQPVQSPAAITSPMAAAPAPAYQPPQEQTQPPTPPQPPAAQPPTSV